MEAPTSADLCLLTSEKASTLCHRPPRQCEAVRVAERRLRTWNPPVARTRTRRTTRMTVMLGSWHSTLTHQPPTAVVADALAVRVAPKSGSLVKNPQRLPAVRRLVGRLLELLTAKRRPVGDRLPRGWQSWISPSASLDRACRGSPRRRGHAATSAHEQSPPRRYKLIRILRIHNWRPTGEEGPLP